MTTTWLNQACQHTLAACCALCSDQNPKWREWRGDVDPPNAATRKRQIADAIIDSSYLTEDEKAVKLAALFGQPVPQKTQRVRLPGAPVDTDSDEFYEFWDAHPEMTSNQARRLFTRQYAQTGVLAN